MTRPEAHVLLGYLKRYRTEHITCASKYDVASEMIAEVMKMLNNDANNSGYALGDVQGNKPVPMTGEELHDFIIRVVTKAISTGNLRPKAGLGTYCRGCNKDGDKCTC